MVQSATLTLQGSLAESVSNLGGEITIWSQDALLPFLANVPENYTTTIRQTLYVKSVSPQIIGISRIDTEDLRLTLGLNPSDIPAFYTVTMTEGTMIDTNETKAVMGYLFADFLKKHVGDNVTINEFKLPLVGIFRTDTWIDNAVIVPYKVAQSIFNLSGRASIIMVAVTDPDKIDYVINDIRSKLENVSVFRNQEAPSRLSPIMNSISWFTYILFAITGVACLFGLTNVTVTGILERSREIGILKALGATGTDVTKMIIYESATLGILGGILGCVISSAFLAGGLLIPITSTTSLRITVFPESLIFGIILSVSISILAALYPIWKAVRVRPNEVLRFG
jgi:putative ABC transport system permease protein